MSATRRSSPASRSMRAEGASLCGGWRAEASIPGLLATTGKNASALPPHPFQRTRRTRVGESGGQHGDRETRCEFAPRLDQRQLGPATGERIGGRGHRLEADEVLILRGIHLRDGIALLEADLEPPSRPLEREHGLVVEPRVEVVVDAFAERCPRYAHILLRTGRDAARVEL